MSPTRELIDPFKSLILGSMEVAVLLDVRPGTVSQWKFRKLLPDPDYTLHCGDVWMRSTIERWARLTVGCPYQNHL